MFESYPEILGVTDLCKALNLSRLKVYELLESGDIKSWRPGQNKNDGKRHVWKVTKENLISYIENANAEQIVPKEKNGS